VWKKNVQKKKLLEWRPTSSFLMEKYMRNRQESVLRRLGGYKHERSPAYNYNTRVRYEPGREQPWTHRGWRQVRQVSPVNLGSSSVTTRGDQAAVDCGIPGGRRTPKNNSSWVSDAIVLVETVLCPISTEEKLADRRRNPAPFVADQGKVLGQGGMSDEVERKRPRLTVNAGRVVVGPAPECPGTIDTETPSARGRPPVAVLPEPRTHRPPVDDSKPPSTSHTPLP
jgi:hypothetical protein